MTASFVYNGAELPVAGDYSYPITFLNNIFGESIIFKARRTFVSDRQSLRTENISSRCSDLRVYSTGDRFCYDGYTLGWQGEAAINKFDKASVVFITGQPGEASVKGSPTYFGTDVQFGAPVQMPQFLQNALPSDKPNGSMVYCSNCRRNTTPVSPAAPGAPAMVVAQSVELFVSFGCKFSECSRHRVIKLFDSFKGKKSVNEFDVKARNAVLTDPFAAHD